MGMPPLTLFAAGQAGPSPLERLAVTAVDHTPVHVLALRDFSPMGFQVETSTPVTPETRGRFDLTLDGDLILSARARVVHCHLVATDVRVRFLTDWEFEGDEALDHALERVVTRLQCA